MAQHQRLQLPRSDEHSHFNGHLTVAFKEKKQRFFFIRTSLLQKETYSLLSSLQAFPASLFPAASSFVPATFSCLLLPTDLHKNREAKSKQLNTHIS